MERSNECTRNQHKNDSEKHSKTHRHSVTILYTPFPYVYMCTLVGDFDVSILMSFMLSEGLCQGDI